MRFLLLSLVFFLLVENNAARQEVIGSHSTSLTHVVVPFFESQMAVAAETLGPWWNTYSPCSEPSMGAPVLVVMLTRPVPSALELNLANEKEADIDQDLRHRAFETVVSKLSNSSRQCFSRIQVCVVRIPKSMDSHVTGARVTFEAMLRGKCIRGDRGYALYSEPDLRPIRSGWLSHLRRSLVYPAPADWTLGSIYRGSVNIPTSYLPNRFHINGNAVYRISGLPYANEPETLMLADRMLLDREGKLHSKTEHLRLAELDQTERPLGSTFADFYFHHVRPFVEQKHGDSANAYDTDVFEFMMESENYQLVRQVLAHRFRFTPMILNFWWTTWRVQEVVDQHPEAVLIHGGTVQLPIEEDSSL